MNVLTFTVGPFAENTYLLTKGDEALLIDPGFSSSAEFSAVKTALEAEKSRLTNILLTHAHVDHVLGLNQVLQSWKVPVWLNHSDLAPWENIEYQSSLFGIQASGFSFTPEPLEEQRQLVLGNFSMDILYTPGHAPDHVSIWFPEENTLIAGDVLFRDSIGRTDLYRGDFSLLADSIRNKLYPLPDDAKVLPGHGPATTIGYEKTSNNFVKAE